MHTLFFSQLLDQPVWDEKERYVGRMKDMTVLWKRETPLLTGICLEHKQVISLSASVNWSLKKGIVLHGAAKDFLFHQHTEEEFYLGKGLLDKQIIDAANRRLARVNDIQMVWSPGGVGSEGLWAVDVGIRGIFRRIGLEFMVKGFSQRLLRFSLFQPFCKGQALQLRADFEKIPLLDSPLSEAGKCRGMGTLAWDMGELRTLAWLKKCQLRHKS